MVFILVLVLYAIYVYRAETTQSIKVNPIYATIITEDMIDKWIVFFTGNMSDYSKYFKTLEEVNFFIQNDEGKNFNGLYDDGISSDKNYELCYEKPVAKIEGFTGGIRGKFSNKVCKRCFHNCTSIIYILLVSICKITYKKYIGTIWIVGNFCPFIMSAL